MTYVTEGVVAQAIAESLSHISFAVEDVLEDNGLNDAGYIDTCFYKPGSDNNYLTLRGWSEDEDGEEDAVEFLVTVTRVEVESS